MCKDFKLPEFHLKDLGRKRYYMKKNLEKRWDKHLQILKRHDIGAAAAFLAALTVMLFVASYVISRLATDHARRNKWFDYDDCGWS